ncbi:hypothetical protein [Flavobacterium sp.]|uniref:hypothetical protein n=1 Tax=Flavobacterium sp. TaxID=239 RepID=UPI0040475633
MKTKILTLSFAISFLFVNCTSENVETSESFSLKTITNDLISGSNLRMSGGFTTLDQTTPNWDCGGAPTDCAPVIIIKPKDISTNRLSNYNYSEYIDSSVESAVSKGLVTKEISYNDVQDTDYVLFTDRQGDKLVYRFKQE